MSKFETADDIRAHVARMAKECSKPGWDSYDALPVDPALTESALAMMLQVLAEIGEPPGFVCSTPRGGWACNYHDGHLRELETEVSPDGWEYLWIADERDPDSRAERTGLSAEEMPGIVARFVARLPAP